MSAWSATSPSTWSKATICGNPALGGPMPRSLRTMISDAAWTDRVG
ncbi:hypothetical protein ACQPZK_02040 [Micromonospora sp. CA-249363]